MGDECQLPPVAWGQPLVDVVRSGEVPIERLERVYRANTEELERFTASLRPSLVRDRMIPAPRLTTSARVLCRLARPGMSVPERAQWCVAEVGRRLEELRGGGATEDEVRVLTWNRSDALEYGKAARRVFSGVDSPEAFEPRDRVLLIKTLTKRLYNGLVGVVVEVGRRVNVRFESMDEAAVAELRQRCPDLAFNAPDGQSWLEVWVRAGDLTPASSTTVHRAQGAGFKHVVYVRAGNSGPSGQGRLNYTACSRAKDTVTLVGNGDFFGGSRARLAGDERDTLLESLLLGTARVRPTWETAEQRQRMTLGCRRELEQTWRRRHGWSRTGWCQTCARAVDSESCVAGEGRIMCLDCHQPGWAAKKW